MKAKNSIISVDSGNVISGLVVISDGEIIAAKNMDNQLIPDFIEDIRVGADHTTVVIEDIMPYNLRLSQQVIDTCKYIGELSYRLRIAGIEYGLVSRMAVKEWVFNTFNALCVERVNKRIEYLHGWRESKGRKGLKNKDGEYRKASFIWVDDRIIIAAMKIHWNIETPKPGKSNVYGLSKHSWQALALATYYVSLH